MKINKILLILAAVALILGLYMLISGNLWGVVLFLAALGMGMVSMMRTRNAAGYGNDDVLFNGIGGTGRQQAEVEKKK